MVEPLGIFPGVGWGPVGWYEASGLAQVAGAAVEPAELGWLLGAGWGSGVGW
ncbi:MAG TPA: hypothetical protein VFJ97_10890 [Dermatophilaceae bacterium]|nr:hypothetical protein [Dermatophilaceae bacterium]